MAKSVRAGFPRIRWEKGIPKLVVHEKREKLVRWTLRALTGLGIAISLFTLPPIVAFAVAVLLALADAILEKTAFYYTSLLVRALPEFQYDGDKWVANVFISYGKPSPESEKIVGLVFNDREYARQFFDLLRSWNGGSSEDSANNIQLTFVTDEDRYYVYLYPSLQDRRVAKFFSSVKRKFGRKKRGKEHFGLIMQLVICHGFDTRDGYTLGTFVNNHRNGKHFLLAPFVVGTDGQPEPVSEVEPISKFHYKAKIPSQLGDKDFERVHWNTLVGR